MTSRTKEPFVERRHTSRPCPCIILLLEMSWHSHTKGPQPKQLMAGLRLSDTFFLTLYSHPVSEDMPRLGARQTTTKKEKKSAQVQRLIDFCDMRGHRLATSFSF
jgi:hypothetical protein